MGTIVYQYRSRIVELENESEQKRSNVHRVRIAIVLSMISVFMLINTDLFSQLNVLNKITLTIGAILLAWAGYEITKNEHDAQRIRTLFLTGAAFLITSMFAMAM